MTPIATARQLVATPPQDAPAGCVMLRKADRAIRLRQLETLGGESFLVDLPQRVTLDGMYGFLLEDGRIIQIIPEPEMLLEIRGNLPACLWQIGWMRQACQIEADRLLVADNPLTEMAVLELGATVTRVQEPFQPMAPVHLHPHGADCGHPPPAGPQAHPAPDDDSETPEAGPF